VEKTNAKNGLDIIAIDGHKIKCVPAVDDPADLPWKELVLTWLSNHRSVLLIVKKAVGICQAGAKKVIITYRRKAISNDCYGINEREYNPSQTLYISSASCTTHCLAMIVRY